MSRFYALTAFGKRALPNQWDFVALATVFAVLVAVARASHGISAPLPTAGAAAVSLDYWELPYYALRTTLRMFAALACSLIFTFTYATLAAKSRRWEMVLIPVLDILQSVPVLGFLSFTVTFFLGLFPGNVLGAECAAVFAIFTSQAWNMAFSFYQSLRTVPKDLDEVSRGFRLTGWQKFWQLEAPFAVPSLIWNTMMSMSGGWFFVVASEAITVGDTTITLPGVGSFIAKANDAGDWKAIGMAVLTMAVVILLYDQLLFRPVIAWAGKFRVELSASQEVESSWMLRLLLRTHWVRGAWQPVARAFRSVALWRIGRPPAARAKSFLRFGPATEVLDWAWYALVAAIAAYALYSVVAYVSTELGWGDVGEVLVLTFYTLTRVVVLMALASLVWVPASVWIGLRPRFAEAVQPVAQFLAAFPVNLLFGAAVSLVLTFHLNPDIWLSFLIVFGTQWYIVFNTIGGAAAFPNDLREASANFRVRGWAWWRDVMLPGIAPYYFTGAITASGGSWNASIVAEWVKWKDHTVAAHGVGAYIAQATDKGDFPRIVLGVAMMSIVVTLFNRLFWRRLYLYAERRFKFLRPPMLDLATAPLLEVSHVSQSFAKGTGERGAPILEDVSLSLRSGEIVALLGRSGCGKSTLLRLISGLTRPTQGGVTVDGKPVEGPAEGVAMVFQSFALFPWLTVLDNVELGPRAIGVNEIETRKRALKAIDTIGLDGFESAYPKELSGGMRQRVGFARALVVQPKILLMDEPFSALDVLTAETLRTDLLDLWHDKRLNIQSILMVTHNIEEAVLMCDRILVLSSHPGRIAAEIANPLPHPRDRLDPDFRNLVEKIYALMTQRPEPKPMPSGPITGPNLGMALPRVSTNSIAGMIEEIAAPPYNGVADLPHLADSLQLEIDELFPLGETLQLLKFVEFADADIKLTPLGRRFADMDVDQRKKAMGEQLIANIPLAAHIKRVLDERPSHRAPATRFREELEDFLSEDYAERTLRAIITLGRYGELFAYDEDAQAFSYENPT